MATAHGNPIHPDDVPALKGANPTERITGIKGHLNGDAKVNGESSPFLQIKDAPIENFRPLRVIVIGGGYSGIYLGIRIPEWLRNVDLTIYEKNDGLGGTWWENRYPGCACDIPVCGLLSCYIKEGAFVLIVFDWITGAFIRLHFRAKPTLDELLRKRTGDPKIP